MSPKLKALASHFTPQQREYLDELLRVSVMEERGRFNSAVQRAEERAGRALARLDELEAALAATNIDLKAEIDAKTSQIPATRRELMDLIDDLVEAIATDPEAAAKVEALAEAKGKDKKPKDN